jgi:bifunctional UDP-N-acetylglucosamine pyrophosphorylase / glucosamine-1-phosphate N-acetyltransferase
MTAAAIILAAGEGTRMRSSLPKVAHRILGVPMVSLVVAAAREAGCDPIVVVTGHRADVVEELLPGETCIRQERQLGTGHAVTCAEPLFSGFQGSVVVLSGDTPLMRPATIAGLIEAREGAGAAASLLTACLAEPFGYGRIVRDKTEEIVGIVEQRDLGGHQESIHEVNTGTYCFDSATLFAHLDRLTDHNAQGEYYLTDIIGVLRSEGHAVIGIETVTPSETWGVNTRVQLAAASRELQRRLNESHMLAGVTMTDPDLVWVAPTVALGRDVVLEPMTFLYGDTKVEDGAAIGPSTTVVDSTVGEGAVVESSVLRGVRVGAGATVGPMGFLRPGTVLEPRAKTGAFVEVKNSTVGEGSKVPHLSYVGDATIGRDVNIGAGTITCNYDGVNKHHTDIGDGAFVGSDTMLVAPVTIGEGAVTGAGSAITKDVPAGALGIERTEQRIVEGWVARKRGAAAECER